MMSPYGTIYQKSIKKFACRYKQTCLGLGHRESPLQERPPDDTGNIPVDWYALLSENPQTNKRRFGVRLLLRLFLDNFGIMVHHLKEVLGGHSLGGFLQLITQVFKQVEQFVGYIIIGIHWLAPLFR